MSGIRVTAGTLRGRKVPLPVDGIRPTSSRAREAVFNILAGEIAASRFLDLFAGTGIMSLEALSRGASSAVAVDQSGRALAALKELAREWEIDLSVRRGDVTRFLDRASDLEPFDIVYADPPYDYTKYDELLGAIDRHLPLSDTAVVVIEHRRKRPLSAEIELSRLTHRDTRSWGQVSVDIYDRLEEPGS